MKDLTAYLDLFMEKTGFPEDSRETFRDTNRRLLADPEAAAAFDAICPRYTDDDRGAVLEEADRIGEKIGVHNYTIELFYFMYISHALRERYAAKQIDDQIFWDSMTDLRAKLVECRDVYGINGSFVAGWFFGFFEMTRFALGRLQFERTDYSREEPYTCAGVSLREGDEMINMHIPSLGPLTVESMMDAFRRAYDFPLFADLRVEGSKYAPFCCGSWLLYPPHYDFLPKHSNILKFMDCFDIIEWVDSEEFHDDWRVFGKYKDLPPKELPRDTSLRRAFADRLIAGKPVGHGFGVFFFDGEKICKAEK